MKSPYLLLPITAALLALAVTSVAAKDAERPLLPLFKAEAITPLCETGLAGLRKQLAGLEALPPAKAADGKKVFLEWDRLQIALEDLRGPLDILSNVDPEPAVRTKLEACLVEANKFSTDLYQSEKLYARIKTVTPTDPVEKKLRQDILDAFEDTGVALPADQRARMKALLEKIDLLGQEYARNIRDNNQKLTFTADEVKGLPTDYLARAKRDDKGNYLLGMSNPEYVPFMENADSSAARLRYKIAFDNKGTPKNLTVLKEALGLRLEMAHLFGKSSYAEYATQRRMARNPAAVDKFLTEVQVAVTEQEKKDIEEIRAFRAKAEGTPLADTKMPRQDISYWQQKLKQARYSIDQNTLRKYFPTDAAVPWVLDISSKLYGVQFKRVEVPVWQQDVQYYDVIDSKSQQRIAGIYLDLFPRDGKYNHAAAWGVRSVSTLAHRTPYSVLVTNFDRAGLSAEEMRTFVHEFGHVLHGVLSHTRYAANAGTNVELDFVEAPSQMYQEWARNKDALALLPQYCKTPCPAVDEEMLTRMNAADNFGRGIRYARQLLYASFDMSLHTANPVDPLAQWAKMEGATPLGYIPGTEFPGQFGHLMGGYAAGYYGYMWSEVLALDMLSAYHGKFMDPAVGMRYRHAILSRGGEMSGGDLVKGFLGRAPNSKAFYDELAGKRP
jgi:thimet oligopeptidase